MPARIGGQRSGRRRPHPASNPTTIPTTLGTFRASRDRRVVRPFVFPNSGRPQPRASILRFSKAARFFNCGGGPRPPPRAGRSTAPPSRRDGAPDRPTGLRPNGHGADLDDQRPDRRQRSAERWLLAGSTRRAAAVAASQPRRRAGGRQPRPAACSDRSRTLRRWEGGLSVLFSVLGGNPRPD